MFYVILLSYLFPNFSKSIVIHVKETCCPCLVKIHVNNIQVTSWPCSLLILCHIKISAGDQCQVHFHLANQLYLLYLVSDLLSTLPDICNHLCGTFFFFFSATSISLGTFYHWCIERPCHKQRCTIKSWFHCFDAFKTWHKWNR